MALFLAGQIPTADSLNALKVFRVEQGSSQAVTSSTTIVDSDIVVPIDGLCEVFLSVRYTMLAGGIRWAWSSTGTVNSLNREIISAGDVATSASGAARITDMRMRQIVTLTEEQIVTQINTSTAFMINERLILEGTGTVTWRFAQQTSNASATTVDEFSYATRTALEAL